MLELVSLIRSASSVVTPCCVPKRRPPPCNLQHDTAGLQTKLLSVDVIDPLQVCSQDRGCAKIVHAIMRRC
jgi:hypothetical protein